jgi:hypothetical protein
MGNAESNTSLAPIAHREVPIVTDENSVSFGEGQEVKTKDMKARAEHAKPIYFQKKTGFLMKKGMGYLYRPWAKRYFVLDLDHSLTYYGIQGPFSFVLVIH